MAAKNRGINTKITLDGEKEYKKQLQDIGAALKQNKAEMEKLSAEYAGNENSTEALTKKSELLTQQMELEQQRIEATADMLEKARAAQESAAAAVEEATQARDREKAKLEELQNAENANTTAIEKQKAALEESEANLATQEKRLENATKAVNGYQLEITKTETSVKKASNAIEDNSRAINSNGEKSKSLGDVIGGLAEKLGVQLPAGAKAATDGINAGTAATAAWAAAAATMITGLVQATKDTTALTDELATQSTITGISTDTLQAWNYAAGLMDVETSTVTSSITRLVRSMSAAQSGSEAQVQAFKRLGVAYKDANGQLRDAEEVWWDAIDALGKIRNESERDAVAMELFGKNARDLNTVIAAGREGFEGFREEAERMGYIMDEETIGRFNRLADEMDRFDNVQQAVKQNLGLALLPILTALFELLAKIDPKIIATVTVIATIGAVLGTIIKTIKSVTDTAGALTGFFNTVNPQTMKTIGIIMAAVAALIAVLALINLIKNGRGSLAQELESVTQTTQQMQNSVRMPQYAAGTDYHPGGWAIVGERGREAVWLPRGARVMTNEQTERALQGAPAYAQGVGFGPAGLGGIVINEQNEFKVDSLEDYLAIKEYHRKQRLSRRKGYSGI